MASSSWEWKPYTRTIHRSVYPAIDPTNPANSAAGKVVLVTGGGSGIGKHIAAAFNKARAKAVIITGRRENILREAAAELEESGGDAKILWFVADVTDEAALKNAFARAAEEVGAIDVVVANAGYMATPAPAASADVADWWKAYGSFVLFQSLAIPHLHILDLVPTRIRLTDRTSSTEINIKGTFLTFRSWLPHKSNSSTPTFISLNTAAAHVGVFPNFSSYSPSEMARGHLISFFQAENPEVRVVSMHPGVLDTEMGTKSGLPVSKDEMSLPTGFAVWLASPSADWVGGRFLWAHWDVGELEGMKDEIVKGNELMWGVTGWPKDVEARIVV
jgi:NAD(P)-dependent dehydrogenase (short-subunit alcohol dehydrogenase family)